MNLLELRTEFVKISGRYDLVVDTTAWADNGANFYINAGMQMLDRLVELPASRGKLYYALSAGGYAITIAQSCRVIREVWINDTAGRWQLDKLSLVDFKNLFNSLASATDRNVPRGYAVAELRTLESTAKSSLGTFIDNVTLEDSTDYNFSGIVIGPPADKSYVVEVSGLFKSSTLSADLDENFWSLEEWDLAIRAALYKLEVFGRGTETSKKWLETIVADVFELDKDVVQEESVGIHQTEG